MSGAVFFLSYHIVFIAVEYSYSISANLEESITPVASGCHNNVKVVSDVYACGNVYKCGLVSRNITSHW